MCKDYYISACLNSKAGFANEGLLTMDCMMCAIREGCKAA